MSFKNPLSIFGDRDVEYLRHAVLESFYPFVRQDLVIFFISLFLLMATSVSKETSDSLTHKKCPFCSENVLNAAIKCKHCGSNIRGLTKQQKLVVETLDNILIEESESSVQETPLLPKHEGYPWIFIILFITLVAGISLYGLFLSQQAEKKNQEVAHQQKLQKEREDKALSKKIMELKKQNLTKNQSSKIQTPPGNEILVKEPQSIHMQNSDDIFESGSSGSSQNTTPVHIVNDKSRWSWKFNIYRKSHLIIYPKEARIRASEGTVEIKVSFDSNSRAVSTLESSSGNDLLDKAAQKYVDNFLQSEPFKKGDFVDSSVVIPINFKLE